MDKSLKAKNTVTALQVASVWFGAHVGGGFATGNQTMNFFVKHGWNSIWLPLLSVFIIGLVYREALLVAKNYGTYNYRNWALKMYAPYEKVFSVVFEFGFLMIVLLGTGGSIAGSAALMKSFGLNYYIGVLITGVIFFILTIYGSGLIRKASTLITVLILIFLTIMTVSGITSNFSNLSTLVSTNYAPSSFGVSLYNAFRYAGFQSFVIAIVLSASDVLKTDDDVNKTVGFGILMNGTMITLSCVMLLAWTPGILGQDLPILYVCKQLNNKFLLYAYSITLFLAFVSTGIGCVFGAVARFETVFKKPADLTKRRALISLVSMMLSMAISLFGLTKIVSIGYGYVGVIGIFGVIIPLLFGGRIKNIKDKKKIAEGISLE